MIHKDFRHFGNACSFRPGSPNTAFTNLFANAIRHMPEAAGVLTVSLDYLEREPAPMLQIRVRDNGSGIDEKDLPFIFDRFFTGETARSPRKSGRGLGLGLSICQEIIASHGGSICVESKRGEGTEFHFTIPIATRPTAVSES
ncbi:sensor histidine kinase [Paenibacillus chartarius]|uniref:histidine kinase n=1 Tax=Paenibacillus chartarius TaxID=747481 RepID=A0ABV6DVN3_9BACL